MISVCSEFQFNLLKKIKHEHDKDGNKQIIRIIQSCSVFSDITNFSSTPESISDKSSYSPDPDTQNEILKINHQTGAEHFDMLFVNSVLRLKRLL